MMVYRMEQIAAEKRSLGEDTQRFLSLDIFRGITICLMIIVNTPGKGGSLFPFLVHAPWFGFTLADLVFPSFLFAVGNAMSFSMRKLALSDHDVFLSKVFKRTVIIFLIGYLLYWFPFFQQTTEVGWTWKPINETRIMGVLQRIALCYFCIAIAVRYFSRRTTLVVGALMLLLYWVVLYVFGTEGEELTMGGNAIVKLDVFLFGEGHVYKRDIIPFDPEGVLSTVPSLVNVLSGYWVGVYIRQQKKAMTGFWRLVMTGTLLILLALCWSLVFPISKKLWTSSFVLYTVGIDILVLCVLFYLIEIKGWFFGVFFFTVLGKNPLVIYLLSELLYIVLMLITLPTGQSLFEWISISIFQFILPGPFGSLATAVVFMMFCWIIAWWLDRKKIYVRI